MNETDQSPAPATADEEEREREWLYLRAASHDLRGPIANVRAYASMLQDPRLELSPRARRAVEVIARNADRALELLREFFDGEQAERGRLELPLDSVPLAPTLESAVAAARGACESRQLRIERAGEDDTCVLAEPGALRHILGVALEAAALRAAEGSTVGVETHRGDGMVTVRVSYRGEGAGLIGRKAAAIGERKLGAGFRLAVAACEAQAMGGALTVQPGEWPVIQLTLRAAPELL